MLGAFLCFSIMDTSAKWLVSAAVPALQVAWLRYVGHFFIASAIYLPKHGRRILVSGNVRLQMLRAMLLVFATALNFTALQFLPLTITIAIFFVVPLTVCLLSVPILGEQVGLKRLMAVLVGFCGVLVIVQPWSESFNPYVFISIAAMMCTSGYFIMSRVVAGMDRNSTTQMYISGIGTICLAPPALVFWTWPTSVDAWILFCVIGTLGMVGHSMVAFAHQHAQASVLAPTVYSQVVFIAILSWVVFGQPPDAATISGTAIIVSSGLYIWFRERQLTAAVALAERA